MKTGLQICARLLRPWAEAYVKARYKPLGPPCRRISGCAFDACAIEGRCADDPPLTFPDHAVQLTKPAVCAHVACKAPYTVGFGVQCKCHERMGNDFWFLPTDRCLYEHTLYKTGDPGAPEVIKDRNGEVVLGLCKTCGRAECELDEACTPRNRAVKPGDPGYRSGGDDAAKRLDAIKAGTVPCSWPLCDCRSVGGDRPECERPSLASVELARAADAKREQAHPRYNATPIEYANEKDKAYTRYAAGIRREAIEECRGVALEQRCERGTPWDLACVAIANAIGKLNEPPYPKARMTMDAIKAAAVDSVVHGLRCDHCGSTAGVTSNLAFDLCPACTKLLREEHERYAARGLKARDIRYTPRTPADDAYATLDECKQHVADALKPKRWRPSHWPAVALLALFLLFYGSYLVKVIFGVGP